MHIISPLLQSVSSTKIYFWTVPHKKKNKKGKKKNRFRLKIGHTSFSSPAGAGYGFSLIRGWCHHPNDTFPKTRFSDSFLTFFFRFVSVCTCGRSWENDCQLKPPATQMESNETIIDDRKDFGFIKNDIHRVTSLLPALNCFPEAVLLAGSRLELKASNQTSLITTVQRRATKENHAALDFWVL